MPKSFLVRTGAGRESPDDQRTGQDYKMPQIAVSSPQDILDFARSYLMPCPYNAFSPKFTSGERSFESQERISTCPFQAFPFPAYMAFNLYTMNQSSYSPLLSLINTSKNVDKIYAEKPRETRDKCDLLNAKSEELTKPPKFDFANLARSATENSECNDCNRNQDAQIISHVMMSIGSLRYNPLTSSFTPISQVRSSVSQPTKRPSGRGPASKIKYQNEIN